MKRLEKLVIWSAAPKSIIQDSETVFLALKESETKHLPDWESEQELEDCISWKLHSFLISSLLKPLKLSSPKYASDWVSMFSMEDLIDSVILNSTYDFLLAMQLEIVLEYVQVASLLHLPFKSTYLHISKKRRSKTTEKTRIFK